jgi:hypothetical protein
LFLERYGRLVELYPGLETGRRSAPVAVLVVAEPLDLLIQLRETE